MEGRPNPTPPEPTPCQTQGWPTQLVVSALHAFGTVVFWADELVPGAVWGLGLSTWQGWVLFKARDECESLCAG